MSADSWCSLMVSMVSRSCSATWLCGLEYRSETGLDVQRHRDRTERELAGGSRNRRRSGAIGRRGRTRPRDVDRHPVGVGHGSPGRYRPRRGPICSGSRSQRGVIVPSWALVLVARVAVRRDRRAPGTHSAGWSLESSVSGAGCAVSGAKYAPRAGRLTVDPRHPRTDGQTTAGCGLTAAEPAIVARLAALSPTPTVMACSLSGRMHDAVVVAPGCRCR